MHGMPSSCDFTQKCNAFEIQSSEHDPNKNKTTPSLFLRFPWATPVMTTWKSLQGPLPEMMPGMQLETSQALAMAGAFTELWKDMQWLRGLLWVDRFLSDLRRVLPGLVCAIPADHVAPRETPCPTPLSEIHTRVMDHVYNICTHHTETMRSVTRSMASDPCLERCAAWARVLMTAAHCVVSAVGVNAIDVVGGQGPSVLLRLATLASAATFLRPDAFDARGVPTATACLDTADRHVDLVICARLAAFDKPLVRALVIGNLRSTGAVEAVKELAPVCIAVCQKAVVLRGFRVSTVGVFVMKVLLRLWQVGATDTPPMPIAWGVSRHLVGDVGALANGNGNETINVLREYDTVTASDGFGTFNVFRYSDTVTASDDGPDFRPLRLITGDTLRGLVVRVLAMVQNGPDSRSLELYGRRLDSLASFERAVPPSYNATFLSQWTARGVIQSFLGMCMHHPALNTDPSVVTAVLTILGAPAMPHMVYWTYSFADLGLCTTEAVHASFSDVWWFGWDILPRTVSTMDLLHSVRTCALAYLKSLVHPDNRCASRGPEACVDLICSAVDATGDTELGFHLLTPWETPCHERHIRKVVVSAKRHFAVLEARWSPNREAFIVAVIRGARRNAEGRHAEKHKRSRCNR